MLEGGPGGVAKSQSTDHDIMDAVLWEYYAGREDAFGERPATWTRGRYLQPGCDH